MDPFRAHVHYAIGKVSVRCRCLVQLARSNGLLGPSQMSTSRAAPLWICCLCPGTTTQWWIRVEGYDGTSVPWLQNRGGGREREGERVQSRCGGLDQWSAGSGDELRNELGFVCRHGSGSRWDFETSIEVLVMWSGEFGAASCPSSMTSRGSVNGSWTPHADQVAQLFSG